MDQIENKSVMKSKHTSTKDIYLMYVIPAVINCLIYVVNISADFVVAVQHFREYNPIWGWCTLVLIIAPAVIYFGFTISKPDWWMSEEDDKKGILYWIVVQILRLIAFPFFALYRYASLIVLSIDALLLSGTKRFKTLKATSDPVATELYFFFQAWFQAAPQALLQTYLLFKEKDEMIPRKSHSEAVQCLCIAISICVIAIKTASFQNYETQKLNGRKLPWAMWFRKYRAQDLEHLEEKNLLHFRRPLQGQAAKVQTESRPNYINDLNFEMNAEPNSQSERRNSITPPLPPKNVKVVAPPTPLRGITTIIPLSIPDAPAPPRPDSYPESLEKNTNSIVTDEQSIIVKKAANNDSNNTDGFQQFCSTHKKVFTESLKWNPAMNFCAFLWWFLFILPRILSISIFLLFYPIHLGILLGVHYLVMLFYLFYYAKYCDFTSFFINLWLGLVYIISIIEYRIKFKYTEKLFIFYYSLVVFENSLMTLTWYFYNKKWDGILYSYAFHAIFLSMSICVLSISAYYLLIRPKRRKIYAT